jgi:ribonucleoside-diphosphate reductase alpha chain
LKITQEIGLPTKGYTTVADLYKEEAGVGEIGLCSLSAINADISEQEYEDVAYYTLLMIDNVISLMEYPFPQLKVTAQARRSLGVGITNIAYTMAKNNLKYSSKEGKQFIHRLAERHSYWLHKASLRLAQEKGVCGWAGRTKYPDGWLPIDTRNMACLEGLEQPLLMDWESLRQDIVATGGLRNSVLEAHMPCESSSIGSGHTNGIYPIRSLKVVKTSGNNRNIFLAPEMEDLYDKYEFAWDIPHKDMAQVYGIIQGFTGQGISADFYRKYAAGADKKVGTKELLTEFLTCVKYGVKAKYYQNSSTGVETDEDACEACKL